MVFIVARWDADSSQANCDNYALPLVREELVPHWRYDMNPPKPAFENGGSYCTFDCGWHGRETGHSALGLLSWPRCKYGNEYAAELLRGWRLVSRSQSPPPFGLIEFAVVTTAHSIEL